MMKREIVRRKPVWRYTYLTSVNGTERLTTFIIGTAASSEKNSFNAPHNSPKVEHETRALLTKHLKLILNSFRPKKTFSTFGLAREKLTIIFAPDSDENLVFFLEEN